jgi:hypothetical protein
VGDWSLEIPPKPTLGREEFGTSFWFGEFLTGWELSTSAPLILYSTLEFASGNTRAMVI